MRDNWGILFKLTQVLEPLHGRWTVNMARATCTWMNVANSKDQIEVKRASLETRIGLQGILGAKRTMEGFGDARLQHKHRGVCLPGAVKEESDPVSSESPRLPCVLLICHDEYPSPLLFRLLARSRVVPPPLQDVSKSPAHDRAPWGNGDVAWGYREVRALFPRSLYTCSRIQSHEHEKEERRQNDPNVQYVTLSGILRKLSTSWSLRQLQQ